MFDHTQDFDFTIKVAGNAIAEVPGKAHLEHDPGYGFIVTAIELDTFDGETVTLSERSIDPDAIKLFRELAEQATESEFVQESFAEALADAA